MQAFYPLVFEREMGCTDTELQSWIPAACAGWPLEWRETGVDVTLDEGSASIDWQVRDPRRIALIVLPRLHVRFEARGVDLAAWQAFMRYFDLYTQRGGG